MTVEELKLEIEQLSEEDRATIHYYLIDISAGFDDASEAEVEASWNEECKRRIDKYLNGESIGVSPESVFTEARELAAERAMIRAQKLSA